MTYSQADGGKPMQARIVGYTSENNEGLGNIPPTNHWTSFLEVPNWRSVRVDVAPGYGEDISAHI